MCPPSDLASTSQSPHPDLTTALPQTPLSQAAHAHASTNLHSSILNHSIRVYVYAHALASSQNSLYATSPVHRDLLLTACLFHDMGTAAPYDGTQRFEVEGGDAAVAFLSQSQFQVSETDKHDVWTAIACHTSPGIAERIGELARLVRLAVVTDFGRKTEAWGVLEPLREHLEGRYEREGIEKVLGDMVVEQAKKRPGKAPMVSWPGVMLKAALAEPEWEGVNKAF